MTAWVLETLRADLFPNKTSLKTALAKGFALEPGQAAQVAERTLKVIQLVRLKSSKMDHWSPHSPWPPLHRHGDVGAQGGQARAAQQGGGRPARGGPR